MWRSVNVFFQEIGIARGAHRVWLRKTVQADNARKRLEYNMGFEYDNMR